MIYVGIERRKSGGREEEAHKGAARRSNVTFGSGVADACDSLDTADVHVQGVLAVASTSRRPGLCFGVDGIASQV
jgi:hypothetical protein